jgi:acyl-CoA dehydrogenase
VNSEERQLLHDAVVGSCTEVDASGWHPGAWAAIGRIGATALSVPESSGGGGAGLTAAAVVLLALGSAGASVPAVETGLMAGWLAERAGVRLPGGIVTAVAGAALEVWPDERGWRLTGTLDRVAWARHADRAVVLSAAGSLPAVLVVPLAGTAVRPGANIAGEPRDDVQLHDLIVPAADVHHLTGPGASAEELLLRAAFGRSVLMAGAAQQIYALAARYSAERRQFGRPLATMQAVQQLLATLAAETSAMTVAAEAAAAAVDRDPAALWTLAAARIRICTGARAVAAIGHQIIGAIGFTDEHPLHRLTTRLWAWREEYGNQSMWSESLASMLAANGGTSLWQQISA